MTERTTQREIARLARVSTATVSRVINRVPSVDPILARRIRKVIEREGYYPNANARALVRGHSRSLGLIVSEEKTVTIHGSKRGVISGTTYEDVIRLKPYAADLVE